MIDSDVVRHRDKAANFRLIKRVSKSTTHKVVTRSLNFWAINGKRERWVAIITLRFDKVHEHHIWHNLHTNP
jgi:hypothetical protein